MVGRLSPSRFLGKPGFLRILPVIFQKLRSPAISLELFSRNSDPLQFHSSYFPETQIPCNFIRVIFQKPSSPVISLELFSKNSIPCNFLHMRISPFFGPPCCKHQAAC